MSTPRTRCASGVCLAFVLLVSLVTATRARGAADGDWLTWRGPLGTGVAPAGDPPISWSEDSNIAWKVALPGLGSASPIVVGDRVFVLTAVGEPAPEPGRGRRRPAAPSTAIDFSVLAIDRESGATVWSRTARQEVPHEARQPNNSFASASAVSDGEHIYAFFGSRGLYCYDLDGNLVWERDLGDMRTRHSFGEGASPAVYDDTLVVTWDHEGPSFIVALDKTTGEERWRTDREEPTTWATPLIVPHGDGVQVITAGTNQVRSYDLASGELLWYGRGLTLNAIPSPVFADGVVYMTAGYRGNALRAVRLERARGAIDESDAVVWEIDRDTPYVPSPLLYDDVIYLVKSNDAIMSAFRASTGELLYGPHRLQGINEIYASPVGVAGRVYVVGRDGSALVLTAGAEPEILAHNTLDDGFDASPAVVDDEIFLRGRRYLYRIAAD